MFLVAVKTAIVESLRSVWFENQDQEGQSMNPNLGPNDSPTPRRITIEYPEEAHEWPFILVQVRPTTVEWTGIMPDEVIDASIFDTDTSSATYGLQTGIAAIDRTTTDDPAHSDAPAYKLIRQGRFEASCMLQIMSTTSMERDRMWDNVTKLLMMGRKRSATNNFYTTLETHDLVGLTVMEGSIRPIGDTISMGTPWDPELLSYEASIEFDMTGVFYADEYTEDLVPLSAAVAYEYIAFEGNYEENEEPPYEGDGRGTWKDPYA